MRMAGARLHRICPAERQMLPVPAATRRRRPPRANATPWHPGVRLPSRSLWAGTVAPLAGLSAFENELRCGVARKTYGKIENAPTPLRVGALECRVVAGID